MTINIDLSKCWSDIPIGKKNAATYADLKSWWGLSERSVRFVLHELSTIDTGDNYILIRSASGKGFYRTDDITEIKRYKAEIVSRGISILATTKKANRIIRMQDDLQLSMTNNLKQYREMRNLKQKSVVAYMKAFDPGFDSVTLSKMENGACMPTPRQLAKLAELYNVEPDALIMLNGDSLYSYSAAL